MPEATQTLAAAAWRAAALACAQGGSEGARREAEREHLAAAAEALLGSYEAFAIGTAQVLRGSRQEGVYQPVVKKKKAPQRSAVCGVLRRDGRLLIARRPAAGLYGGMFELPGDMLSDGEQPADGLRRAAAPGEAAALLSTHRESELVKLCIGEVGEPRNEAEKLSRPSPDPAHQLPREGTGQCAAGTRTAVGADVLAAALGMQNAQRPTEASIVAPDVSGATTALPS